MDHPQDDEPTVALSGHEKQECVELLNVLSNAKESSVRGWATFGLGTQIDWDSLQLRDALLARLNDEDEDTRAEAHFGLALRKDHRGIPALIEELSRPSVGDVLLEAARELGCPLLHPSLKSLKRTARTKTSPSPQPSLPVKVFRNDHSRRQESES